MGSRRETAKQRKAREEAAAKARRSSAARRAAATRKRNAAAKARVALARKRSEAAKRGHVTRARKRKAPLRAKRVEILGEVSAFGTGKPGKGRKKAGFGLHGADKDDWIVLRAKVRMNSEDWQEFRDWGLANGYSYSEIADEWFSPEI